MINQTHQILGRVYITAICNKMSGFGYEMWADDTTQPPYQITEFFLNK